MGERQFSFARRLFKGGQSTPVARTRWSSSSRPRTASAHHPYPADTLISNQPPQCKNLRVVPKAVKRRTSLDFRPPTLPREAFRIKGAALVFPIASLLSGGFCSG